MINQPRFRAWDLRQMKMLSVCSLQCILSSIECYQDGLTPNIFLGYKEFHLMQYIGLKDKKANEIYVGDIYQHGKNNYVIVNSDNFGFILIGANDYETFDGVLMSNQSHRDFNWIYRTCKHCEVIGNIYDNKELIK